MRSPDFELPGYLRRWYLFPGRVKERWNAALHHVLASDSGRDLHDHAAWNVTIVLRGWYTERFLDGTARRNRVGHIRFRRAALAHRIEQVSAGGCWTIWIRGGHRRTWGFWTPAGWVPWRDMP